MEDHWRRQLRSIEDKTQYFKRSVSRPGDALDARLRASTSQNLPFPNTIRNLRGLSPENKARSENIGRIGSRIYGPTVEDAMHEFSKRTTDIMKVMHTVGSELAQVQSVLSHGGGPTHTKQTSDSIVSQPLTDHDISTELQHLDSIQHSVLQVGNLIDLLIKTLGVGELQKLSLFGKVSTANKGIGQILDSTKAIKGQIQHGAAVRAGLKQAAARAQRQYDQAQRALEEARKDLHSKREGSSGLSGQQLAEQTEGAESKVLILTQEVEQYQNHLREVNARCRQLEDHLAMVDSSSEARVEQSSRELQLARSHISRLNQELDEFRDIEIQTNEAKTSLQQNLMSEISSIMREVARKKIQTADEIASKDRTIVQLESAEQATARQTMNEVEASRRKYESELRLLRDELAAAKHAHELSLVKLEYSSQAKGSSEQASSERQILELEHRASQLETEMAQYKTQARTAAELLKEHREQDPILELQTTKEELQEAKHQAQLRLQEKEHELALARSKLSQISEGQGALQSEVQMLEAQLSGAQEECRLASEATSNVRAEWAERVARLEQELATAVKTTEEASRVENELLTRALEAENLLRASSARRSPSSRGIARASLVGSRNSSPRGRRESSLSPRKLSGAEMNAPSAKSSPRYQSTEAVQFSSSATQKQAFTLEELSTSTARRKVNGADDSDAADEEAGDLLRKQAQQIRNLQQEHFELRSHTTKLESELAEAQEDTLLNATTSFVSTRQYRRAVQAAEDNARTAENAEAECTSLRKDLSYQETRIQKLQQALDFASEGENRLRKQALHERDLVEEAKRAVEELRNGEDSVMSRARSEVWAETETRVRGYRAEAIALRKELVEARDNTYSMETQLQDLQSMADESRAALATSKSALVRVEADLERFSGDSYRQEVSRLKLQLKEARMSASRSEDAKKQLQEHNANLRHDFTMQLDTEREKSSEQIVSLRNELAEQSVTLLATRSEKRIIKNEIVMAQRRVLQALETTKSFEGASTDKHVSQATDDTGAQFMRTIMMLISRLEELFQQYKLTKEMLQQQTEGLEQMKSLARGESANASSHAMRLQMELASRDQEAFEKAKRMEQQHTAQLRQVEANHRTVQENLAAEIKDLRSRLVEAVRSSSTTPGYSSDDATQLAKVMDDLNQWRSRAHNLESTVVALRQESHELKFEHEFANIRAVSENARLKDQLSDQLAKLSQSARADAMKAENVARYRDEARSAEIQIETLRRRLEDAEARQKSTVARAEFASESKIAELQAQLATANAALREARVSSTNTPSLAQEKMAVEQELLKSQLQNERLEAQAVAESRELEATKIELLQVAARASAEKNDLIRMQEGIHRENMSDLEERAAQKDARLRKVTDELAELRAELDQASIKSSVNDASRTTEIQNAEAQSEIRHLRAELNELRDSSSNHGKAQRDLEKQRQQLADLQEEHRRLQFSYTEERDRAQRLSVEAALRSAKGGSMEDDAQRKVALDEMQEMQHEAAEAKAAAAAAEERARMLALSAAKGEEDVAKKLQERDRAAEVQAEQHAQELAKLKQQLRREAEELQAANLALEAQRQQKPSSAGKVVGISLDDAASSDSDIDFDDMSAARKPSTSEKVSKSPPQPDVQSANKEEDVSSQGIETLRKPQTIEQSTKFVDDDDDDSDWDMGDSPKQPAEVTDTKPSESKVENSTSRLQEKRVVSFDDDSGSDFDSAIPTMPDAKHATASDNADEVGKDINPEKASPDSSRSKISTLADDIEEGNPASSAKKAVEEPDPKAADSDFDSPGGLSSDDDGGMQLPSLGDEPAAAVQAQVPTAPKPTRKSLVAAASVSPSDLPDSRVEDIRAECEKYMDELDAAGKEIMHKAVRIHVSAHFELGDTGTKPWKRFFHDIIEAVYDKWDEEDDYTNSADFNSPRATNSNDRPGTQSNSKDTSSAAAVKDEPMVIASGSDFSDIGSMDMSD